MAKLSLLARIGNAAAVLLGRHGDVARSAEQHQCSRQTAYDHARLVHDAVAQAQLLGPSREELLQENAQLRQENRQLWDLADELANGPSRTQILRFVVQAAAMGLSLVQTHTLLALLVAHGRLPGRSTLGHWVRQQAKRAGQVLAVLDGACQLLVTHLCLDEIYCHRHPVLMAVEPFSMVWALARRTANCAGATWARALACWPGVREVTCDAGSGLEAGLRQENERRQQAGTRALPAVPLRVGLDVFHTQREGERALRREWKAAEKLWDKAVAAEKAKARFDRGGTDRRGKNQATVDKPWAQAEAAFAVAQQREQAWRRVVAALQVYRPDGQLNDRAWAQAEMEAALAVLEGDRWAKVKRLLRDPRALVFLDRLQAGLAEVEPCPQRRALLVALWRHRRWWRLREEAAASPKPAAGRRGGRRRPPEVAEAEGVRVAREALVAVAASQLGPDWQQACRRVGAVVRRSLRASSAVECVNSVVRMHQARHRSLTQELLDLKRLYWNCRAFVSGRRKGRCPYEHLGLRLPTYEAWELLQMDPAELQQKLSSPRLAA
jgi:hypothetical protein